MIITLDFLNNKNACKWLADWFSNKYPTGDADLLSVYNGLFEAQATIQANWLITTILWDISHSKCACFLAHSYPAIDYLIENTNLKEAANLCYENAIACINHPSDLSKIDLAKISVINANHILTNGCYYPQYAIDATNTAIIAAQMASASHNEHVVDNISWLAAETHWATGKAWADKKKQALDFGIELILNQPTNQ